MVDSGASTHATSRRDLFSTDETRDFGVVCLEIMARLISSI